MDRSNVVFGVVAFVAIAATVVAVLMHPLVGLSVFIIGIGAFVLQGMVKIPADPPHKGAETKYEERTGRVIDEGWRFFPFFPFVFGFIPVDVAKKNVNLKPQKVLTPDMARVEVPVHYTFLPGDERTDNEKAKDLHLWNVSGKTAPDFASPIIAYLNSGGEDGVKDIISDVIAQVLRIWGVDNKTVDPDLGRPRESWKDVVRAGNGAVRALATALSIRGGGPDLGADANAVANGTRNMFLPSWGITLTRINIGEIEPMGDVAKAAEKGAKERSEQEAEVIELDHIEERVEKLMEGLGMTYGDAVELIQTEREKVTKTINEQKFNVSPEAKAVVEGVLAVALSRLIPKEESE